LIPKIKEVGMDFLSCNDGLKTIELQDLEELPNYFMGSNTILESIIFPKVKKIGENVLASARRITRVVLPEVEDIEEGFLYNNEDGYLEELFLQKVKNFGDYCFTKVKGIRGKLSIPNVETIGKCFFEYLEEVEDVDLPMVISIGDKFLSHNISLTKLYLPNVEEIGHELLKDNTELLYLELPEATTIGNSMLQNNQVLESFIVPNLKQIYFYSLSSHPTMKKKIEELLKKRQACVITPDEKVF
jgi:hypothetical protein